MRDRDLTLADLDPPGKPGPGTCTGECDVVICDDNLPIAREMDRVARRNPARGAFDNEEALEASLDKVCAAAQKQSPENGDEVCRELRAIQVTYNPRMLKVIGRCMMVFDRGDSRVYVKGIEITGAYDIHEPELSSTLVHELCHAGRALIDPTGYIREQAHGPKWRHLMLLAGETPSAYCVDPVVLGKIRAIRAERAGVAPEDYTDHLIQKRRDRREQVAALRDTFQKEQLVEFKWHGRTLQGKVISLGAKSAAVWVSASPGHGSGAVRVPYGNLTKL